jgi:alpha-ketoglutarate-dependent taurine dioxygenase
MNNILDTARTTIPPPCSVERIGEAVDCLSDNGFALIDDIDDTESHVRLAACFGKIRKNDFGDLVHKLSIKTKEQANVRSHSASHGKGMFPYHSDTAFWHIPCRLLSLRAVGGDLRRSTRIIRTSQLLDGIPKCQINQSSWIVCTGRGSFYSGLTWHNDEKQRFRLDLGCMKPANQTARSLQPELIRLCNSSLGLDIAWKPGRLLVLNNWQFLHSRSGEVENEGMRMLERIYLD